MGETTAKSKLRRETKTYTFEVVIEEDNFDDGRIAYHAYCPSLKGASTWSYTEVEAFENIREVAKMTVESMIEHMEAIPEEARGQNFSGRQVSVTI